VNTEIFNRPIIVMIDGLGQYSVRSIRSAVRFITTRWPEEAKGQRYEKALHACSDVIEGYGSVELAERAFRLAAAEAGILVEGADHPPRQQELHRAA